MYSIQYLLYFAQNTGSLPVYDMQHLSSIDSLRHHTEVPLTGGTIFSGVLSIEDSIYLFHAVTYRFTGVPVTTDAFENSIFHLSLLNVETNGYIIIDVHSPHGIENVLEIIRCNDLLAEGILEGAFINELEGIINLNDELFYVTIQPFLNDHMQKVWSMNISADIPDKDDDDFDASRGSHRSNNRISLKTLGALTTKGSMRTTDEALDRAQPVKAVSAVANQTKRVTAVNLDNLPPSALFSAEGLVKALRAGDITPVDELDSPSRHAPPHAPLDIEFTRYQAPDDGMRRGTKLKKPSDAVPLFKALGFVGAENSFPTHLVADDHVIKNNCLKAFNTRGFPAAENEFRRVWELKFDQISCYFATKSSLSKALRSICHETGVRKEVAFSALAYCDGSVLETLSRLVENLNLKQDIAAVCKLFPVTQILEYTMHLYDSPDDRAVQKLSFEGESVASRSTASSKLIKQGHHVGLVSSTRTHPSALALDTGHGRLSSDNAVQSDSQDFNASVDSERRPSVTKFRRFSQEIDVKIKGSRTMDVISRKEAMKNDEYTLWTRIQSERRKHQISSSGGTKQ